MATTLTPHRVHPADIAGSEARQLGWHICLGEPAGALVGLIRRRGRLRIVIGEPLTEEPQPDIGARVRGLARTLLVARQSAAQTATRLAGLTMWPDLDDREAPRLAVTVMDLAERGIADVACRFAPSVVHAGRAAGIDLLPLPSDGDGTTVRLNDGERLIAYSASFLGSVDPETLAHLPALARPGIASCALWDQLAASRHLASHSRETPADLVIITRSNERAGG